MSKGIISALSAFAIALIGLFTVNVGSASAAMVFHSGFEGGSTLLLTEWASMTGTPSVQSSIKHTGTYAMRCNTSAATAYVTATATVRLFTFYLYIATAPLAETTILGSDASGGRVRLTNTRYLTYYSGATLRGTSTTQLALGTWYRVSGGLGSGAATNYLAINGTKEVQNVTVLALAANRVGVTTAATTDLYFDDVAFDGTFSTTEMGDIRVAQVSLPNAAGNYTQFDTVVPNGATHYTTVDDPPGTANFDADYCQHAANSGNAYDTYNIQDASAIGISDNDTINAVRYLGRMSRGNGGSGTHNLAVRDNGSDYTTAVSATTTFTWYARYNATMPNGGGSWTQARLNSFEVGAYHGSGNQDTNISAVMVMAAYTPSENISITPPPPTSYDFGVVAEGSIKDTTLTYFTVTNNSADAVNISISGDNMTGGVTWVLSDNATPGADIYGLMAGTSSYNIIVKKNSPFNNLVQNLAAGATQSWGLQLLAPTLFSDSDNKTSTITLTATYS